MMKSYLDIIGSFLITHGTKIVLALDMGFAGIASQWQPPTWLSFTMIVLNGLAGVNNAVIQPKMQEKKLLFLKRQFCIAANAKH
jgi:hypothetical protein